MKNYLFIIAALISFNSFAQDAVISTAPEPVRLTKAYQGPYFMAATYTVPENEGATRLEFRDQNYKQLEVVFSFNVSEQALDLIKPQIIKLQKSKMKEFVKIDMGNGAKLIMTRWAMKYVEFEYTSSVGTTSACALSKGQMKKVFGVKI